MPAKPAAKTPSKSPAKSRTASRPATPTRRTPRSSAGTGPKWLGTDDGWGMTSPSNWQSELVLNSKLETSPARRAREPAHQVNRPQPSVSREDSIFFNYAQARQEEECWRRKAERFTAELLPALAAMSFVPTLLPDESDFFPHRWELRNEIAMAGVCEDTDALTDLSERWSRAGDADAAFAFWPGLALSVLLVVVTRMRWDTECQLLCSFLYLFLFLIYALSLGGGRLALIAVFALACTAHALWCDRQILAARAGQKLHAFGLLPEGCWGLTAHRPAEQLPEALEGSSQKPRWGFIAKRWATYCQNATGACIAATFVRVALILVYRIEELCYSHTNETPCPFADPLWGIRDGVLMPSLRFLRDNLKGESLLINLPKGSFLSWLIACYLIVTKIQTPLDKIAGAFAWLLKQTDNDPSSNNWKRAKFNNLINVSLNIVSPPADKPRQQDVCSHEFTFMTLMELTMDDMLVGEKVAASKVREARASVTPEFSFLYTLIRRDCSMINNLILNQISSHFGNALQYQSQPERFRSRRYVFGLTCEKGPMIAQRKVRVMVADAEDLEKIADAFLNEGVGGQGAPREAMGEEEALRRFLEVANIRQKGLAIDPDLWTNQGPCEAQAELEKLADELKLRGLPTFEPPRPVANAWKRWHVILEMALLHRFDKINHVLAHIDIALPV